MTSYVEHYHHERNHHERNHQGLDNLIPFPYAPAKPDKQATIRKSERLGGLLNFYHREPKTEMKEEAPAAA